MTESGIFAESAEVSRENVKVVWNQRGRSFRDRQPHHPTLTATFSSMRGWLSSKPPSSSSDREPPDSHETVHGPTPIPGGPGRTAALKPHPDVRPFPGWRLTAGNGRASLQNWQYRQAARFYQRRCQRKYLFAVPSRRSSAHLLTLFP